MVEAPSLEKIEFIDQPSVDWGVNDEGETVWAPICRCRIQDSIGKVGYGCAYLKAERASRILESFRSGVVIKVRGGKNAQDSHLWSRIEKAVAGEGSVVESLGIRPILATFLLHCFSLQSFFGHEDHMR